MILGCYYLTIANEIFTKKDNKNSHVFSNFDEALEEYQNNRITVHTPIWVNWNEKVQNLASEQYSHERNTPFEIRCDLFGNKEFYFSEKYIFQPNNTFESTQQSFVRTTAGRILLYKLMNSTTLKSQK